VVNGWHLAVGTPLVLRILTHFNMPFRKVEHNAKEAVEIILSISLIIFINLRNQMVLVSFKNEVQVQHLLIGSFLWNIQTTSATRHKKLFDLSCLPCVLQSLNWMHMPSYLTHLPP
jgi:hypothetical protein